MPERRIIDLRSDTVTQPTPAMREAMAQAEVGDDVFREDPTVQRLEEMAAERMGKEAAVFVASGTMGNLTCLLTHCQRGDEAIVGSEAHVLHSEAGGAAGLGAIQLRTVPNDAHGMLDIEALEATIRGRNVHHPRTAVVCLENTQNRCGGGVLTPEETAEVAHVAHDHGVAVHLDGARIFNAVVATGTTAATWAEPFDTVTFCLSKGLGAPVGSLICGSTELIGRVHRARKMLGGGMRQAGIVAAAGIHALEHHVDRLAEDHANARRLAAGLEELGFRVGPAPETNMVMFGVDDTAAFLRETRARSLLINPMSPGRFRAVHLLRTLLPVVFDPLIARVKLAAVPDVRD